MEEFPRFKKLLDTIFGTIKEVFNAITGFISGDISLGKLIEEWGAFGLIIAGIGTYIDGVISMWSSLLDILNGDIDIGKMIKDKLGGFDVFGLFGDDKNLASPKTGSGGGATSQTNDIKIEVNGSGDPTATGDAVASALQRSINGASAQLPRNQ